MFNTPTTVTSFFKEPEQRTPDNTEEHESIDTPSHEDTIFTDFRRKNLYTYDVIELEKRDFEETSKKYRSNVEKVKETFEKNNWERCEEEVQQVRANKMLVENFIKSQKQFNETKKEKRRFFPQRHDYADTTGRYGTVIRHRKLQKLIYYCSDVMFLIFNYLSVDDLLKSVTLTCWFFYDVVHTLVKLNLEFAAPQSLRLRKLLKYRSKILTDHKVRSFCIDNHAELIFMTSHFSTSTELLLHSMKDTLKVVRFNMYIESHGLDRLSRGFYEFQRALEGLTNLRVLRYNLMVLDLTKFPNLKEFYFEFSLSMYSRRIKKLITTLEMNPPPRLEVIGVMQNGYLEQDGDENKTWKDMCDAFSHVQTLKKLSFPILYFSEFSEEFVGFLMKMREVEVLWDTYDNAKFLGSLANHLKVNFDNTLRKLSLFITREVITDNFPTVKALFEENSARELCVETLMPIREFLRLKDVNLEEVTMRKVHFKFDDISGTSIKNVVGKMALKCPNLQTLVIEGLRVKYSSKIERVLHWISTSDKVDFRIKLIVFHEDTLEVNQIMSNVAKYLQTKKTSFREIVVIRGKRKNVFDIDEALPDIKPLRNDSDSPPNKVSKLKDIIPIERAPVAIDGEVVKNFLNAVRGNYSIKRLIIDDIEDIQTEVDEIIDENMLELSNITSIISKDPKKRKMEPGV